MLFRSTKWDVGKASEYDNEPHRVSDNEIHVYFDSAWSPPTDAYYKLEDLGFEVKAYYYEGGMGFWGEFIDGCDTTYSNGEIPQDIKDRFGIEEYTDDFDQGEGE